MLPFGKLVEPLQRFTLENFGEGIVRYNQMMVYKIIIFGVLLIALFLLIIRFLTLKYSSKNNLVNFYSVKFVNILGNIFLHLFFPLNCCYLIENKLQFSPSLYFFFFTVIIAFRFFFYYITGIIVKINKNDLFLRQYKSTITALIVSNLLYFATLLVENIFFLQQPFFNSIFIPAIVYSSFLVFDIIGLIKGWVTQKLSFFLIILYLCTLKILPIVYLIDILWFFYEH